MNLRRSWLVLGVWVFFALPRLLSAADEAKLVVGRIEAVDPATGEVKLTTDDGKSLTFHVDQRSRLRLHQHQAALDQFKPGTEVRIRYEAVDGRNRVVRMRNSLVSADVRRQAQDALRAIRSYTYQQKEEYEKQLRPVLDELNDRLDDLKAKAREAGAQARKEYAEQIEKLQPLRDKVADQLAKVKDASPGAWEDLKAGIASALMDLHQAIERANSRFKEKEKENDK